MQKEREIIVERLEQNQRVASKLLNSVGPKAVQNKESQTSM